MTYSGLKEERFEVCCRVADHVEENCWDKGGEDDGQEVPPHLDDYLHLAGITWETLHLV